MKKRGKPKPKPQWQRTRKHAVQLYISDDELANLRRECAARGCTASDYFRSTLQQPAPKPTRARKPRQRKAAAAEPQQPTTTIEDDPRQVTVMQHLEATA